MVPGGLRAWAPESGRLGSNVLLPCSCINDWRKKKKDGTNWRLFSIKRGLSSLTHLMAPYIFQGVSSICPPIPFYILISPSTLHPSLYPSFYQSTLPSSFLLPSFIPSFLPSVHSFDKYLLANDCSQHRIGLWVDK